MKTSWSKWFFNKFVVTGVRRFYKKGKETVLALEGEQFDMECKAEVRLTYCAFHHPSGKRFS